MIPSDFNHPLYHVEDWSGYNSERTPAGSSAKPEVDANVVSSQIEGADMMHTVMLDIDLPATLLPSSTEGHSHLYIDHPMPWEKYQTLLEALADAGVIEEGYARASIERRGTHLRIPGTKKEQA